MKSTLRFYILTLSFLLFVTAEATARSINNVTRVCAATDIADYLACVVGVIMNDTAREAGVEECKGTGYTIPLERNKRDLNDLTDTLTVPASLAVALASAEDAVFSESMVAAYCKALGLGKDPSAPAKWNAMDTIARLYAEVWELVAPETATKACEGAGYGKKLGSNKTSTNLIDNIIPIPVAEELGVVHSELASESMAETFCKQFGLGKN